MNRDKLFENMYRYLHIESARKNSQGVLAVVDHTFTEVEVGSDFDDRNSNDNEGSMQTPPGTSRRFPHPRED